MVGVPEKAWDFCENQKRYEVHFKWTAKGRDRFFQALITNHGKLLRHYWIGGKLGPRYTVFTLVEISKYRIEAFTKESGARVKPGLVVRPTGSYK